MKDYEPKHCLICNNMYVPTGQCAKYCDSCKDIAHKEH